MLADLSPGSIELNEVQILRSDPETRSRLGTVLLNSSKKPTRRLVPKAVRRDGCHELDDLAGVVRGANPAPPGPRWSGDSGAGKTD